MKLPQLLLFRVTLFFALGIASYPFLKISFHFLIGVQIFLLLFCVVFKKIKTVFWLSTLSLFWLLGIGWQHTHDDSQKKQFYANFTATDRNFQNVEGKIHNVLKTNRFNSQYEFQIQFLNGNPVCGKLLLLVAKDSLVPPLQIDDHLQVLGQLETIPSPKNPHQFDYSIYMGRKGIYDQLRVKKSQIRKTQNLSRSIRGLASEFRAFLISRLEQQGFKKDNESVIKALVLGDRTDISPQLRNSYVDAGAIHLLAISGLHIGVLLLLLNGLFFPLLYLKNGRFWRLFCVVICLWAFAFITGLSASVVRAVTMFSAVAIGSATQRSMSRFQTLLISIFVLLLIQPHFIYDVGFQLSYAAVFGILWLMPLANRFWNPHNWILKKFWQLFALGVIAQLFVLPLGLFYFHQFPLLFFIANLVIVPFMGLLLGGGIAIVIMSALQWNVTEIIWSYNLLISCMNGLIEWVANQNTFVIRNISFGVFELILVSVMVIGIGNGFEKPTRKRFLWPLLTLCVLLTGIHTQKINQSSTRSFWIFQSSRKTVIAKQSGNHLQVFTNIDSIENYNMIQNFAIGKKITQIHSRPLRNVFLDPNLLIVDKRGVYIPLKNKSTSVLLIQNPKIHLGELIDSLQPKQIISDGSNYPSLIRQWEKTCSERNVPFYNTFKQGSLHLNELH